MEYESVTQEVLLLVESILQMLNNFNMHAFIFHRNPDNNLESHSLYLCMGPSGWRPVHSSARTTAKNFIIIQSKKGLQSSSDIFGKTLLLVLQSCVHSINNDCWRYKVRKCMHSMTIHCFIISVHCAQTVMLHFSSTHFIIPNFLFQQFRQLRQT
jgi:hypothetical protein